MIEASVPLSRLCGRGVRGEGLRHVARPTPSTPAPLPQSRERGGRNRAAKSKRQRVWENRVFATVRLGGIVAGLLFGLTATIAAQEKPAFDDSWFAGMR